MLYLVNQQKDNADTAWVTEVWRSQTDLDVSLARIRGSEQAATVMALVKDWQMIELVPLGGKGPE
jgi:quinol monooxygenase YgiN